MTSTVDRQARILMTGSRQWALPGVAEAALGAGMALLGTGPRSTVLVHGAAAGADSVVAGVATSMSMGVEPHPAQWNTHGPECQDWCRSRSTCRLAGHRRNSLMINTGADLCLAFPAHGRELPPGADTKNTSRGTWDCAEKAAVAGLPTLVVWGADLYPFNPAAAALLQTMAASKRLTIGGAGQLGLVDTWLPF